MFNLSDDQALELRDLAIGLLGAKPGQGFGQNLAQGLLLADQNKLGRKNQATQEQLKNLQLQQAQMQMAEQQRQQQTRERLASVAQQAFAPGQMPADGMGPPTPGGGGLEEYYRQAIQADPLNAPQYAQALQPKADELAVYKPGDVVVNKRTQEKVFSVPDKQPDWMNPAYRQFQMDKARAGASRVNVENRQESEFGKGIGKAYAEDYMGLMKSDAMASSKLTKLGRLENLLTGVSTGKLTPTMVEIKSAAEALGFKVDPNLGPAQAAAALSNELALQARSTADGAGMPGAMSDADRNFLVNMVPGLSKTPEGNKLLIETHRRIAKREKEIAKLAREYKKRTGKFDDGFYDIATQYHEANPLFSDMTGAAPAPRVVDFNSLPK